MVHERRRDEVRIVATRSYCPRRLKAAGVLAGLLLGVLVCGCRRGPQILEGYAPAFGTVTLDGKPIQDAQLIFATEKGDSYGRTDENGYYEAERSRATNGAGLGPAIVKITTTAVFPDMSMEGLELNRAGTDYVRPEQIPSNYRRGIEIEVTPDGAPYDFDLTSTPQ
jgi:hypothetical protein